MKAFLYAVVGMLVLVQVGCTSGGSGQFAGNRQTVGALADDLSAPDVSVMPFKDVVVLAWTPVENADGYFVFRETDDAKALLGIGPKGAEGFVDRHPPAKQARYSVQAFRVSAPSDVKETETPASSVIPSSPSIPAPKNGMKVAWDM